MNNSASVAVRGQRSATRLAVVQALYQIDVADISPEEALGGFKDKRWSGANPGVKLPDPDNGMLNDLVLGVCGDKLAVDTALDEALVGGHSVERLEILLRAVLRAGAYELKAISEVPPKVVINEYVNLAHAFFAGKEPALVNAVLDRLANSLRSSEEMSDKTNGY